MLGISDCQGSTVTFNFTFLFESCPVDILLVHNVYLFLYIFFIYLLIVILISLYTVVSVQTKVTIHDLI